MKGYKAFEKGLVCRGKQYAENTVFEENEAEICKSGMHFCQSPMDVLDYYPLVDGNGEFSDFATVKALDKVHTNDNKKFCTKKLKIDLKFTFAGFINAAVDFLKETTAIEKTTSDSSGDDAKIGSSGDGAQIGSSGNGAKIGSSGDWAIINSTGENSVICCVGRNCKAKAKIGSWITLSEWEYSDVKRHWIPKCVKTEYVDGKKIKADTWYKLENGEFVEVTEDE